MTKIQRVKKLIKWLIFSDFGENEADIAKLLGYTKSSFSQIVNEKVPLSDKFIDKICGLSNNINKVWIIEGGGNMLVVENNLIDEPNPVRDKLIARQDQVIELLENENKILKKEILELKKEREHSENYGMVAEPTAKLKK